MVGHSLLGRYDLKKIVGRGGIAEVYLAWDTRRNYEVAIKVLAEDLVVDREILRVFAGEAYLLARLAHANIVRFYSFEHRAALAILVMDYIEGLTSRHRLQNNRGRPLPLQTATVVVQQVGAAVHYAHTKRVIHRDLKPSNIILRSDGRVPLSDFDTAQARGASASVSFEAGSPVYMSPEKFQGETLDIRTDIYSLGLVAYEMLAGCRPFLGDTPGAKGSLERESVGSIFG